MRSAWGHSQQKAGYLFASEHRTGLSGHIWVLWPAHVHLSSFGIKGLWLSKVGNNLAKRPMTWR
jgi:hypothetical protein